MRLLPDELKHLPRPFTPAQARAVAGVGDERQVMIAKSDGRFILCEEEKPINLETGDEIELVPPAESSLVDCIAALKREPNAALPEGFRAINDVVSEIERDPTRKGELDKAREHLRQFVSPAPESPLVERLEAAGRDERLSTGALYLEAATALSLAQTEIKGHMRVKDDLDAEVIALNGIIRVRTDALTKAQARIAELEKALAAHGTDAQGGIFG